MEYRSLSLPISLPADDEAIRCIARVQENLRRQAGIRDASVNNAHDTLRVVFDPERITTWRIEQEARRAGIDLSLPIDHLTLALPTLDSLESSAHLVRVLRDTPGILWAGSNFPSAIIHVEFDRNVIGWEAVRVLLSRRGYASVPLWNSSKTLPTSEDVTPSLRLVSFLRRLGGMCRRRLPWILLLAGTAALGWWGTVLLLLALWIISDALRNQMLAPTRQQIWTLLSQLPHSATVRREDSEITLPIHEVRIGDQVLVAAGAMIPLDGVVTHGTATVDAAPLFGQDSSYDADVGSPVFAGSRSQGGALEIRVLRHFVDTPLVFARHAFAESVTQSSPEQSLRESWRTKSVNICLWLAVAVAFVPPYLMQNAFPANRTLWALHGLSVAAFALSESMTFAGTLRSLLASYAVAQRGIVVRNGSALSIMGRIKALVHARTGVLTEGRPAVVDVVASGKMGGAELVAMAAALEVYSTHPLGRAICHEARQHTVAEEFTVSAFEAVPGRGVRGIVNDVLVMVGSPRLFNEERFVLPRAIKEALGEADTQGLTPVLVGGDGGVYGLIVLRDTLRPTAARTVGRLREMGVFMQMVLSGDTARAVETVTQTAGIAEWESEQSPDEKVNWIGTLRRQYGAVGFVGDGEADRAAFAAADVSLSLRAGENPAGLEAADIAILNADTEALAFLRQTAGNTQRSEQRSAMAVLTLKIFALTGVWTFALPFWMVVLVEICATLIIIRTATFVPHKAPVQSAPVSASMAHAAESLTEAEAILELVFVHDPAADEQPVPGFAYPRWEAFVVPFTGEPIQFGRKSAQSTLSLQVTDDGMSRLHGEIRLENRRPVLVDLRSTNGIRRNGRTADALIPPEKPVALRFGDVLMVGRNTRIEVRPPGESAQVLRMMAQNDTAQVEKSGTAVR